MVFDKANACMVFSYSSGLNVIQLIADEDRMLPTFFQHLHSSKIAV